MLCLNKWCHFVYQGCEFQVFPQAGGDPAYLPTYPTLDPPHKLGGGVQPATAFFSS